MASVITSSYKITIIPRRGHQPEQSGIFVPDDVAEAADPELAKLAAEEAALGELRWCPSVREGGSHPEVDALYTHLNGKIMLVKTQIARQVIPVLAENGVVFTVDAETQFDRNAGCLDCPCSPGVAVSGGMRFNGQKVDVWVEAANERAIG